LTIRVYLVGEGTNDIGSLARESMYQEPVADGFLQPVLRRFTTCDVVFVGRQIKTLGRERIRGVSEALSRKGHQARSLAGYEHADVVVVALDVDRTGSERASQREADRRIASFRADIESGFVAAGGEVKTVVATPCRTIEAWALADTEAASQVAGADPGVLPRRPEELWGNPRDPNSNHPKCVFTKLFGGSVATRQYAEIAEQANLDTLATRCPKSFAPFAADVRAAYGGCFSG
jgi:hypothetical protein